MEKKMKQSCYRKYNTTEHNITHALSAARDTATVSHQRDTHLPTAGDIPSSTTLSNHRTLMYTRGEKMYRHRTQLTGNHGYGRGVYIDWQAIRIHVGLFRNSCHYAVNNYLP